MSSVTRVSQMKIKVDLCYFDSIAKEYRKIPSKAEYSGAVLNSKPHGAGIMKFKSGAIYLGNFEHGELLVGEVAHHLKLQVILVGLAVVFVLIVSPIIPILNNYCSS